MQRLVMRWVGGPRRRLSRRRLLVTGADKSGEASSRASNGQRQSQNRSAAACKNCNRMQIRQRDGKQEQMQVASGGSRRCQSTLNDRCVAFGCQRSSRGWMHRPLKMTSAGSWDPTACDRQSRHVITPGCQTSAGRGLGGLGRVWAGGSWGNDVLQTRRQKEPNQLPPSTYKLSTYKLISS
jgi:hypothetical protein